MTLTLRTTTNAVSEMTNNIVWDGDSLTYGENGSNAGTIYATRVAIVGKALGSTWSMSNLGVPGQTVSQMIARIGSTVSPLYDGAKANNYLVVQGGHNDINLGADAATVIARIQDYLRTVLAANAWKVIWSTQPPAGHPVYPPHFNGIRDAINMWMRSNWQRCGVSALADVALDFRIGINGCENNPAYYSSTDHTHPTDAGYSIWAEYDLAAVDSLLSGGFVSK
jgi:lysophospholipase L1-like esterase